MILRAFKFSAGGYSAKLFAAIGLVVNVATGADAATITARSTSLADVNTAVISAKDGDTVVVPAGTASWTSTLAVTKGITIQGATTTDTGAGTVNDQTIIVDNVSPRGAIIAASMTPTQSFRLTGFTFRPGTSTTFGDAGGIHLDGTCPSIRVDHCHFDQLYQAPVMHTFGWLYGVIDHSIFECRNASFSVLVWHNTWGGRQNGDGSWAESSYWGSEKFIFVEDNIIKNVASSGAQTNANLDCKMGGRYVARYNKFYNTVGPNTHGTEGSIERGSRAIEVYNNTFNWTFSAGGGQVRGGGALYHDNTYTGVKLGHGVGLTVYRLTNPFDVWGGANGNNSFDLNDTTGGPNGNGLYCSGKHTGPNSSLVLKVAVGSAGNPAPGWKTNQWVGYEVTNLDQPHNTIPYNSSYIQSNTIDTITFPSNTTPTYQPALAFNNGNRFEIRKVLTAIDQPGRGKGALVSGSSSATCPDEELDPVYCWNNKQTVDNSNMTVQSAFPTVIENRDYYNNTPKPGYTPYKYPHPLTGPAPPSNLAIVSAN